jgi:hypothetical protein
VLRGQPPGTMQCPGWNGFGIRHEGLGDGGGGGVVVVDGGGVVVRVRVGVGV